MYKHFCCLDLKSPEIINLPETPIKNLEDDAKTSGLPSEVPKVLNLFLE